MKNIKEESEHKIIEQIEHRNPITFIEFNKKGLGLDAERIMIQVQELTQQKMIEDFKEMIDKKIKFVNSIYENDSFERKVLEELKTEVEKT